MKRITHPSYLRRQKSAFKPLFFHKSFYVIKEVKSAVLTCSAIGIYDAQINEKKIGSYYLTPGFTSYHKRLQFQSYDVKNKLKFGKNNLDFNVSGGWAVGPFGLKSKTKNFYPYVSLCFSLKITYVDNSVEEIISDKTCKVGESKYKEASIYNGEIYDANFEDENLYDSKEITLNYSPKFEQTLAPVVSQEELTPIKVFKSKHGYIFDFGQNFAGVIKAKIRAKAGQKIEFYHSEVLWKDELFTKNLRKAKARLIYISKEGEQTYIPLHTYMGFRYVEVRGIELNNIELKALALYSNFQTIGDFKCSNQLINKLQNCIVWGGKSNFVDIPTDCPQRDERLGWTGDTALFSKTACFNFDMTNFYKKWLQAMRDDQKEDGSISEVVPDVGNMKRSVPVWSDTCVLVPWNIYFTSGNIEILKEHYSSIKSYIRSVLKHLDGYVWSKGFTYGDWCAPYCGYKTWIKRGKVIATAYFYNSLIIASKIAKVLNQIKDEEYFKELSLKVEKGFKDNFVLEDGTIKGDFQTVYVLAIYFNLVKEEKTKFVNHLARLIKENNYHLSTGFPGTPFVLFALADNGKRDLAFKLLMQDDCPSWLYEVKAGATTMWERWDALRKDGTINLSDVSGLNLFNNSMVSFNHYAYGAVGDFLYSRIG